MQHPQMRHDPGFLLPSVHGVSVNSRLLAAYCPKMISKMDGKAQE
jgi:hypothetical protein